MEFTENQLWEYHLKEKKKRNISLGRFLEMETGIVIDRLLDENRKEVKVPSEIDGYPVNRIGKKAFMDCKQLESVELPDSVVLIEEEAFAGCERLAKINLPAELRHFKHGIFKNCTGLTEVEFPSSPYYISFETFQGCTSLKKVKLPERLVSLQNKVFEGCVSLETVELPEGLRKIEQEAFRGCSGLKMLRLPDTVNEINAWAFDGCCSLKEIILPEGIIKIEKETFRGCTGLERIQIPASVVNIGIDRLNWITALNEENIGKIVITNPLKDCESLQEICVCVGSYAHAWARENGYRSILCTEELPVEYDIDEETHTAVITGLQNRKLERLVIPGWIENCYVTKIASEAFTFCDNLDSVVVPEPVRVIDEGAFRMCSNLRSIQLPESVVRIADTAITGCTDLKEVYVKVNSYAEEWATEYGFKIFYS